jgi:hypothetical protein
VVGGVVGGVGSVGGVGAGCVGGGVVGGAGSVGGGVVVPAPSLAFGIRTMYASIRPVPALDVQMKYSPVGSRFPFGIFQ